jgi:hypothetical protein
MQSPAFSDLKEAMALEDWEKVDERIVDAMDQW